MDITILIILAFAVVSASCLQSATGIGYGVIAGPFFLITLNGVEAFQVSTIHNFWIALILLPSLWRQWNHNTLRSLIPASFLGILTGFFLQASVNVLFLKIAATCMLLYVSTALIRDMRCKTIRSSIKKAPQIEIISIGALTGIMGGMLAMPGPLAATWMSLRGTYKEEVRATILAFFVFAFGLNLILYACTVGFSADIIKLSLWMLGPIVVGIIAGNRLASRLSEITFRFVLLIVLLLTMLVLCFDWILLFGGS